MKKAFLADSLTLLPILIELAIFFIVLKPPARLRPFRRILWILANFILAIFGLKDVNTMTASEIGSIFIYLLIINIAILSKIMSEKKKQ